MTLHELERRGQQWLELYAQGGKVEQSGDWARLVAAWPQEDVDNLLELLAAVGDAAGKIRAALAKPRHLRAVEGWPRLAE
jgi:hypothetical protein